MAYYIQTNILCILLLAGINMSVFDKRASGQARRVAFRRLVHITIVMCVADMAAWLCDGKTGAWVRPALEVVNIVYYSCITWSCFAWLNYVNVRIRPLDFDHRRRMVITSIPILLISVATLTNPLHHFFFDLTVKNQYIRGDGIILHWIVCWGYLLVATAQTLHEIHRAKTRVDKRQLTPMLWFIVAPAMAAVCQMIFYGITTMQAGITLSIIMISVGVIREQISNDVLTGLNNRRALENYVNERLDRPGRTFSILMCDIDDFKNINDTYGHAVGDLALKTVSKALKEACGRAGAPVFLCRYGGDEFVICGVDLKPESMERLQQFVREYVQGAEFHDPVEQELGISIGLASGVCQSDSDVDEVIRRADRAMYEDKKVKGIKRMV